MLHVKVEGHLTREKIEALFAPVSDALDASPTAQSLIFDVSEMSGYDVGARQWWVSIWSPRYRPRLSRMALVTQRTTWRMLTAAVALATGQNLKAFSSRDEAAAWAAPDHDPAPTGLIMTRLRRA